MKKVELKGLFYELEEPDYMKIIGGEVRFYKNAKRISFSKNPTTDNEGVRHMGKTVTVNLGLNQCDQRLIGILEKAVAILKGEQINEDA